MSLIFYIFFFFSSRRRHTRLTCDWSSDVCSSDLWEREGASLEVRNESRNSCRFHSVASSSDGIVDKGELTLELCKFISKASAVVVVAAVSLNLSDGIPVIEVRYCLA